MTIVVTGGKYLEMVKAHPFAGPILGDCES